MLTAAECRAKAEHLAGMADTASGDAMVLELESMATEWRKLAVMAEWQDALESQLRDGF
jgi:hypothetical protein